MHPKYEFLSCMVEDGHVIRPQMEADTEFWGVYENLDDGRQMHLVDVTSEREAEALTERLNLLNDKAEAGKKL